MSLLPRLLIFAALGWLAVVLFNEARAINAQPEADATQVVLLFGGVVLVGGVAGILFVLMIMPMLGDWLGNLFFQPNQPADRDPHAAAVSALARGNFAGAIDGYSQVLKENPGDTLAYSEIARILCEHLDNPTAASQTLEQALQGEWSPDDAAFLSGRLVDVYWKHLRDVRSARAMLLQIIESLPGSRHAANAQHRLQEIEQQIALDN